MNRLPKKYLIPLIVILLSAIFSFIFLEKRIDKPQFIWAILNIALLLVVIAILFQVTERIRQKWGYFSAGIIFLLGLTLISSTNKARTDKTHIWSSTIVDSLGKRDQFNTTVVVHKTGFSKYLLLVQSKESDSTHAAEPYKAQVITEGVSIGTSIEPFYISIEKNKKNSDYTYVIDATIRWTLLGIPIYYYQQKTFNSTFKLK